MLQKNSLRTFYVTTHMKGGFIMLTLFHFILGLCLGSFIVCTAERLSSNQPVWGTQRSICPNCQHQLRAWQLIPLLGVLLQRGRCHDCQQPIPLQSSLVERLCGVLVATSPGPLTTALPLIIGYLVLIFNSLTDYLNYNVYPLTLITPAVLGLWQQRPNLDIGFYILLVLIVTLYLLARLTPTFGLGDVDVLLMLGCLATANAILTSLALASTAALVFFILGSSKRRLPFVPFISWGFILVTQLVGPT